MFVILFPILFYIPKFFEVHSHYETTETIKEIDCGRFLQLGKMLNNTRLRAQLVQRMEEEEVAKIEHLANECQIIIDKEMKSLAQLENVTAKNESTIYEITEIPITDNPYPKSTKDQINMSINRTISKIAAENSQRKRKHRHSRDIYRDTGNKGERSKEKGLKTGRKEGLLFVR